MSRWILTGFILALLLAVSSKAQEREPVFLREIAAGKHRITIVKEDFEPFTQEVELSKGEIETIHIDLEQRSFFTSFPSEQIAFGGRKEPGYDEAYRLPHGRYKYHIEDGELQVTPVFPNDGLLTAMNISIPVCMVVSALLTINDLTFPPDSGLPLSPITLSAYGITAGVVGVDVALHLRKHHYIENAQKKIKSSRLGYHLSQGYYEKGQEMLSQNRMNEALESYTWVLQNGRESLYFPYSLYQIAKIHSIQGESEIALQEFNLIIDQFPLYDLYDKSLKALADLYFAAGEYKQSLELLDAMVFLDPLYQREEIELYRNSIREKL
jgi:hypothetical protein